MTDRIAERGNVHYGQSRKYMHLRRRKKTDGRGASPVAVEEEGQRKRIITCSG